MSLKGSGCKGAAAKWEIIGETSGSRLGGGGFEGWMKIPPLLFPFRCFSLCYFSLLISPFGVSPFVLFFSLVNKKARI